LQLKSYRKLNRNEVKELALKFLKNNQPLDWFEVLYKKANEETLDLIPWADFEPNPNLTEFILKNNYRGSVLNIGCGLGDDAEFLANKNLKVDAFDISETAIKICKQRFPISKVNYFTQDALQFNPTKKYDLVVEAYTLQVLPVKQRMVLIEKLPQLLNEDGTLLIICRGREKEEYEGDMPFPLTKEELKPLEDKLKLVSFEDYMDGENPPVRRFRISYKLNNNT